jgi:hypothetical protein
VNVQKKAFQLHVRRRKIPIIKEMRTQRFRGLH